MCIDEETRKKRGEERERGREGKDAKETRKLKRYEYSIFDSSSIRRPSLAPSPISCRYTYQRLRRHLSIWLYPDWYWVCNTDWLTDRSHATELTYKSEAIHTWPLLDQSMVTCVIFHTRYLDPTHSHAFLNRRTHEIKKKCIYIKIDLVWPISLKRGTKFITFLRWRPSTNIFTVTHDDKSRVHHSGVT